jgi:hypothetical protein
MRRTRRLGAPAVTTALVLSAFAAATALAPAAQASSPVVLASLNFATPSAGKTVTSLDVGGAYASSLSASVVTANGGHAVSVPSPTYNNAIALPPYSSRADDPPYAIVAIRNTSASVDALDAGSGAFTWQADFYLANDLGSDPLDGDNLLQRGLSPNKQWKLSVDRHRAQCFARTVAHGPEVVTPAVTIPQVGDAESVHWYRAICTRSDSGVLTLRVLAFSPTERTWSSFASTTAPTLVSGDLDMDWNIPVSVGGKLTDTGAVAVAKSPDQLNGSIDNVIMRVG